jgi:hypothetical protein
MLKYSLLLLCLSISLFSKSINPTNPTTPANGSIINRFTTSLSATSVTGATLYEFQIDTVANMNSGWVKTITSAIRIITSPALSFNKTYYWRVRCSDSLSTSAWSQTFTFSLGSIAIDLNKPANNLTGPIAELACVGVGIDSSIRYLYEVDTTINFSSSLHKIYSTAYWLDSADIFSYGRTIYWRATATNLQGDTFQWSVTRKYTIQSTPTFTGGNTVYGTAPLHKLTWGSAGLSSIEVQFDTLINFTSPILESHLLSKGITVDSLKNLLFGKYYYCRIKWHYGQDTTPWSAIKKLLVRQNGNISNPSFNGATIGAISNINFGWSQLDGTTCRAKLFADSTETLLLADTIPNTNSFQYTAQLKLNKWYQLHVTYYHEKDTATTLESNFKIYSGQVSLIEPANNSVNIPLKPRLRFLSVSWATNYLLEIDTGSTPNALSSFYQQFTQFDSLATYLSVNPTLHYNQKYVWRVSAIKDQDTAEASIRNFTTIAAPTNYFPPNNFVGIGTSINALVKTIDSSLYVQWELDTSIGFSSPQLATGTDLSIPDDFDPKYVNLTFPPDLRFQTKYFWRTRCINSVDTSSWSAVFAFTTTTDVFLNSPINGATNIPVRTKLDWSVQGSNLDQRYQYQLATDSLLDVKPIITLEPEHFSEDSIVCLHATTYYWRARAFHTNDTSRWSTIYSFRTINLPSIGVVSLLSPANGAVINPGVINLGWNFTSNAESYDIEIAINEDFSSVVATGNALGTGAQFSGAQSRTKYYWRVRGRNSFTTGPWNGRWFQTGSPVGIEEVDNSKKIKFYPNPADDKLLIESMDSYAFQVHNIEGKLMMESAPMQQTNINTQNWAEGIYILTFWNNTQSFHQKININHTR